jgi:predicted RNase H-like HicB family nuclease
MKSKRTAYPVILTPDEKDGGFDVYIPDFEKNTCGNDIYEALEMAQDAIEMVGVYREDENLPIPAPSKLEDIAHAAGSTVTLVAVDFDEYRRKTETKAIKKTLSLPSWLNAKAEAAGINFSAVLQDALKERLAI